jgi:plastocyanin
MRTHICAAAALAAAALCGHAAARADIVEIMVHHDTFVVESAVPGQGTAHATIQVGDTVMWDWMSPGHSVTADDGSFDSGVHSPPFTYSLTFDQPGVYPYYCVRHGAPGGLGMAGTITVVGGGCATDWDGSGTVNSSDISAFLSGWLASLQDGTLDADFNGDATVNSSDISAFLTAWLTEIADGC